MISLKRLNKNPVRFLKARPQMRPTRPSKKIRPPKKQGKTRSKYHTNSSGTNEKTRPLLPEPTLLLPKRRYARIEIFSRSLTITAIKKVIMPPTTLSLRQKNSCSLGNFHVGDYEFRG